MSTEDLLAVIEEAGGSALVMGGSSGAALALEAAAQGLAITRLASYEPPFIVMGASRRASSWMANPEASTRNRCATTPSADLDSGQEPYRPTNSRPATPTT